MTEIQNSKRFYDLEEEKPNLFRSLDTRPVKFRLKAGPRKARNLTGKKFETCPLVPLAASPCLSAIGCASGECRAGLAGGLACNGRRIYL